MTWLKNLYVRSSFIFTLGLLLCYSYRPAQVHLDLKSPHYMTHLQHKIAPKGLHILEADFYPQVDVSTLSIVSWGQLQELSIAGQNHKFLDATYLARHRLLKNINLKTGEKYKITAKIHSRGTDLAALRVRNRPQLLHSSIWGLGLILIFSSVLLIFKSLNLSRFEWFILLAGFALRTLYIIKMPAYLSAWDFFDHEAYAKLIIDGHFFPPKEACGQCFQPPIGYWFISPYYFIFSKLLPMPLDSHLQLFSLLLSAVLMLQLRAVIKKLVPTSISKWLLASLVFWPLLIFKASPYTNDTAIYIMWFLFLILSLNQKKLSLFLTTVLGTFTKFNFLILPLSWLISKLLRFRLWLIACGLLCFLIANWWFSRTTDWGAFVTEKVNPAVMILGPDRKVDNSFEHVFGFSLKALWHKPILDHLDDQTGRQYLWVYFLKSLVVNPMKPFKEDVFLSKWSGRALILLITLMFIAFGYYCLFSEPNQKTRILAIQALLATTAVASYRIVSSYAMAADSRYALPALLCGVIYVAIQCSKNPLTQKGFKLWSALMILCTLLFYIGLPMPTL